MKRRTFKILIADDEPDILDYLSTLFADENFEVITATDGIQAIKQANLYHPDIILLDIKMPNLEGTEVCSQLRSSNDFNNTPIVFLTAQNTEARELEAFKLGANDFIAKPIKPTTLVSRIQRLLPKSKEENNSNLNINIGQYQIIHDEFKIIKNGKAVNFAKKEFEIIQLLTSKPGKVFTREELFRKVWGNGSHVSDRTIDVHIRKIRVKAGDDFIKTIKGVGFKVEE